MDFILQADGGGSCSPFSGTLGLGAVGILYRLHECSEAGMDCAGSALQMSWPLFEGQYLQGGT